MKSVFPYLWHNKASMINKLLSIYRSLSPRYQNVYLDYPVVARPRYGDGKPAHTLLHNVINEHRNEYTVLLKSFLQFTSQIRTFKKSNIETDERQPVWNNGFLPGLDIVSIYGLIALYKPASYIEIGSGNSTKVARRAINDHDLKTTITSIDPHPRASIDELSQKVIRTPLENIEDTSFIVESLLENDILFIDNSHRVLPNSDVMVCFLELLPLLRPGVIVHIHDVFLPFDYPQNMCDRFYSEQYLLAAILLANPVKYKPLLPNFFISGDEALSNVIAPMWEHSNLVGVEQHGTSFWLQIGQ